mmetsp:Transcript_46535/g.73993  ORF Transcript_46535/g.73993 Transcript_46535/m.73993 type:complete len:241 (+) Transcript_46535:84-806(+)
MSIWWLSIGGCVLLVSCARPSATSFAEGPSELHDVRTSNPRQAVLQMRQRYRHRARRNGYGASQMAEVDPDERAKQIEEACGKTKDDEIKLHDIRACVEALQSYAQATREGFIQSISAEKIFVREYQNAAKKLALLGDTELFWKDIQKEHQNALVFLTNLASKVGEDAKDLKVYSKLKKKNQAKSKGNQGEDEDEDEDEDEETEGENDSDSGPSEAGEAEPAEPGAGEAESEASKKDEEG